MDIIKHCFKDFQDKNIPESIYFDTSFVVNVMVKESPYYLQCKEFISKLLNKQSIIIFSSILLPELWCAVVSICIRNQYEEKVKVREAIHKKPKLIRHYFSKAEKIEKDFRKVLTQFENWIMVPVNEKIISKANLIMPKYCLPSMDAIHIATAEEWAVRDIVAIDRDLEDLPLYETKYNIWTVNGWDRFKKRHQIQN
ncbi:MAG: type II toxin-antitoxin system VapC family toxin [Elusimicrobiota bacterium]